jgi:DNA-binding CsgD family transcriptional regulator
VARLRHSDLDGVVRAAGELAALVETDEEPFPEPLLESLRVLIGSDAAGYSQLDRVEERSLGTVTVGGHDRDEPAEAEAFWAFRHEWPSCVYTDRTLDFRPHKLSDFVTTRELRRLQIYTDYLRPYEYEISVGLPAPLTHTKMFLFVNGPERGDFGERERTMLELLRPHLIRRHEHVQALRRARAILSALETSDEPLVLLDDAGRPEFATPRARRLLASYGYDLGDIPSLRGLVVRRVRPNVLLLEERRPLGLTPREREILALVAQGQTNAQIARTLWISPATVGKHLENAYGKLGVTSRTAAVRLMHEHRAAGLP